MSTLLKVSAPIPELTVMVSDSEGFAVRGLNPLQVVALYQRHSGELEPMFQRVMGSVKAKGSADADDLQPLLLSLLTESPSLVAELISLGSGGTPDDLTDATITDPVSREPVTLRAFDAAVIVAQHLPFPVQVDALSKIARLTFTQDMPPGKFLALALTLLRKASGAVGTLNSLLPAQNGSGASGDPSTS